MADFLRWIERKSNERTVHDESERDGTVLRDVRRENGTDETGSGQRERRRRRRRQRGEDDDGRERVDVGGGRQLGERREVYRFKTVRRVFGGISGRE